MVDRRLKEATFEVIREAFSRKTVPHCNGSREETEWENVRFCFEIAFKLENLQQPLVYIDVRLTETDKKCH